MEAEGHAHAEVQEQAAQHPEGHGAQVGFKKGDGKGCRQQEHGPFPKDGGQQARGFLHHEQHQNFQHVGEIANPPVPVHGASSEPVPEEAAGILLPGEGLALAFKGGNHHNVLHLGHIHKRLYQGVEGNVVLFVLNGTNGARFSGFAGKAAQAACHHNVAGLGGGFRRQAIPSFTSHGRPA